MADEENPTSAIDALLSATLIAHEAIADIQLELAAVGADSSESRGLVAESARITLQDGPRLSAEARRLASKWDEQRLLDSDRAALTMDQLRREVPRVELALRRSVDRQRQIALRLASLLRE